MAKDKPDKNCLACGQSFIKATGKKEAAVKCMICCLWCHKSCAGVSDEYLKILEEQLKATGVAYWACRSCAAYNRIVNSRFQEIEKRMDHQEGKTQENTEAIRKNEDRTEEVNKKVEKLAEEMEKMKQNSTENWMEEMRERELRRENIIVYGVEEAGDSEKDGRTRAEADLKKLDMIFMATRANIPTKDAVSFSRRVGEKGEEPRPLVVGFHEEQARKRVLRGARNLKNSPFSHVTIAPDLTKLQRKAEDDLKEEATKRNRQLTTEEKSKNLQWLVVGQRGTRRLIKGVSRFPTQSSQLSQKRKAEERHSPDSRKKGRQSVIDKLRSERSNLLLPSSRPRGAVGEEVEEVEENSEAEREEYTDPEGEMEEDNPGEKRRDGTNPQTL